MNCGDDASASLLPSRKERLESLGDLLVTMRSPSGVVKQFFPSREDRRLTLKIFSCQSLVLSVDFDLATVFGLLSDALFEVTGIEFLLAAAPGWSVFQHAPPRDFGYIIPAAALRAILDRSCFRGRESDVCATAFALKRELDLGHSAIALGTGSKGCAYR